MKKFIYGVLLLSAIVTVGAVLKNHADFMTNTASQVCRLDDTLNQDDVLPSVYAKLQEVSVRVDVGVGCGSGVLVTRQVGDITRTYVWTAGHVAEVLQNQDGSFRHAKIHQECRLNGLYKYKEEIEAKVIAYSAPDDEDLALLEVLKDNFTNVSATFANSNPSVGTELVHVGSTVGLYNSVSLGIISQTDREIRGKMFDQTSCMGYPGSSGGGVYLKSGECVGLLTRGIGPGLNFIVPIRRMNDWAKKMKIEWALNGTKVPLVRAPTDLESSPTPAPKKSDPFGPCIKSKSIILLPF